MAEDLNAPTGSEFTTIDGDRHIVTGPSAMPGYVNITVYDPHGNAKLLTAMPSAIVKKRLDHDRGKL